MFDTDGRRLGFELGERVNRRVHVFIIEVAEVVAAEEERLPLLIGSSMPVACKKHDVQPADR